MLDQFIREEVRLQQSNSSGYEYVSSISSIAIILKLFYRYKPRTLDIEHVEYTHIQIPPCCRHWSERAERNFTNLLMKKILPVYHEAQELLKYDFETDTWIFLSGGQNAPTTVCCICGQHVEITNLSSCISLKESL